MESTLTRLATITLCAAALAAPTLASVPFFTPLGDFAGGEFHSGATAISADGSTVVGAGVTAEGWQPFRWTAGESLVPISPAVPYDETGLTSRAWATATSQDGSTIVGYSMNAGQRDAWKWTATGGYQPLNHLPTGPQAWASAYDCSADGSVIVGDANPVGTTHTGARPVRWTQPGDPAALSGTWSDSSYALAATCSADSSVIAGLDFNAGPYRWSEPGGIERLDAGSFEAINTRVEALSADGSIAVGSGFDPDGLGVRTRAVRWDAAGNLTVLPDAADGTRPTWASNVSPDGSVIIGAAFSEARGAQAFIWDQAHGTRVLRDVLEVECGLDLSGWFIGSVSGIADDNLTIVGAGVNIPQGARTEAFIARLPEPGTLVSLALITLLATRRRG
jgi:uncharacterized membrane protein